MWNTILMPYPLLWLVCIMIDNFIIFGSLIQKRIKLFNSPFLVTTLLPLLAFHPTTSINYFLLTLFDIIQQSITISIIIFELSFVYLNSYPYVYPQPLFFINPIIPFINLFLILPYPISMSDSMLEIALIYTTITPIIFSISLGKTVYVLSFIELGLPMYLSPFEKDY